MSCADRWKAVVLAAWSVVILQTLSGRSVIAQQTGPNTRALTIESLYGRDLYGFYCAACHGRDAKGDGPAVPALRTQPADLTTIAVRNQGVFPRKRVEAYVTGEGEMPAAHGSRDMPVWGPIFRSLDPSDARNRVRIGNIVDYIASIQSK
jgi:mono/diheme cytochrome c family protein